jgi:hypothetical protein
MREKEADLLMFFVLNTIIYLVGLGRANIYTIYDYTTVQKWHCTGYWILNSPKFPQ